MNPIPFVKNRFTVLLFDWKETQITSFHGEAVKFDIQSRLHTTLNFFLTEINESYTYA